VTEPPAEPPAEPSIEADAGQPLILTLALHPDDQERLNVMRRRHFPPDRNYLAAHVTLFHKLPGHERAAVLADLDDVSRRAPFAVDVTGVRSLGRGVALTLASPELLAVRAELAGRWQQWLGPQDGQRFKPHVTVQNKVTPEQARAVHQQLAAAFVPHRVKATGLALWTYLGGPWGHEHTTDFAMPRR
jgi:2'-5' RNA ligase